VQLKKITMFGFKSFAQKTTISFDGSVVAVVGPNGCGKSNIVDAFRWAMGEQSGKLRGQSMEDVLFSGTKTRAALNLTEVSVTFSDVQAELNTPFDELTIIRRLTRDQNSEYFLNKKPVRLKEIQLLLMGSGVGKNTLAIFEQGKLDQIIYLAPTERRKIFDEAAGIGRFLQRKHETRRKLGEVRLNFLRLQDTHQESQKQLVILKKQASVAKAHRSNQKKAALLQQALLHKQKESLVAKNQEKFDKIVLLKQARTEQTTLLAQKTEEKRKVDGECSVQKQALQTHEKELLEKKNQLQIHAIEQKELKKREEEFAQRATRLQQEMELREKQFVINCQEVAQKKEQHRELKSKSDALGHQFQGVQERESEHDQLLAETKEQQKQILKVHLENGESEKEAVIRLHAKEGEVEQGAKNLEEVEISLQEVMAKQEAFNQLVAEKRKDLEALASQMQSSKQEQQAVEKEHLDLKSKLAQQQEVRQACASQITELAARKKILVHLHETQEGFSQGAKALLKEASKKKGKLYGKVESLADYFFSEAGYESALLVRTQEDLSVVTDFAKKEKLRNFSLVCLEHLIEKKKEGTLREQSLVLQKKELDAITKKIAQLVKQQKELDATIDKWVADQTTLERRRQKIDEKRRILEMSHLQESLLLKRAEQQIEECQQSLSVLEAKKESLLVAQKERQSALQRVQKEHQAACLKVEQWSIKVAECQEVLEAVERKKESARTLFLQTNREHQEAFQKEQQVGAQLAALQTMLGEHENKKATLAEEKSHLLSAAQKCAVEFSQGESSGETLVQEHRLFAEKTETFDVKIKELEANRLALQGALARLEKESQQALATLHELELQSAHDLAQLETIESQMQESATIDDLKEYLVWDLEKIQKELAAKEYHLSKGGSINFASIEALEKEQEQFKFLDDQLEDLQSAKDELEKLIKELDSQSRKQFKEHFAKVRAHFKKHFALLFDGGEADLKLSDQTDIFDAGVEILAKPPGKKMRTLSLLSGGERCLTALALLFAFFAVKPAPFCVLDEVDAPLDESNIGRFTALLQQYTDQTQFLVVTHNQKTMAMADLLVGVSMEEKGVSKLLSLSFENEVKR